MFLDKTTFVKGNSLFRKTSMRRMSYFLVPLFFLLLTSCQGYFSEKPPIHLNPNMDNQAKKKAQTMALRPPADTIPFGRSALLIDSEKNRETFLEGSASYYFGVNSPSDFLLDSEKEILRQSTQMRVADASMPAGVSYVGLIPAEVDVKLISRGLTRYGIYCAVCHGPTGVGDGPVVQRGAGIPRPTSFLDERIVNMPDGELFNIITHGRRNMQGYKTQIAVSDRWAIVSYLRTLQESSKGVPYNELSVEETFRLFLTEERDKKEGQEHEDEEKKQ